MPEPDTFDIDELQRQFPEGCLVRLRSGGPNMVVELTREDEVVAVTWFDDGGRCHRDGFHHSALLKIEEGT